MCMYVFVWRSGFWLTKFEPVPSNGALVGGITPAAGFFKGYGYGAESHCTL